MISPPFPNNILHNNVLIHIMALLIHDLGHFHEAILKELDPLRLFPDLAILRGLFDHDEPITAVRAGRFFDHDILQDRLLAVRENMDLGQIFRESRVLVHDERVPVLLRVERVSIFESDDGFHDNSFPKSAL